MHAWSQDACEYLSQEVPVEAQTPGMYNSLMEARSPCIEYADGKTSAGYDG